jgi:stage III sporulation protein AF
MEFMRSWIISVAVSAMLIAIAEGLMPAGTVKKVGKLTGGLVLMLGMLQPIVRLDYEDLFLAANGAANITMETKEEQQESNDALLKSIIERELNAYVLDKAQSFGYSCTVSIFCELGENNVPYPDRAEIRGLLAEEQRQKITKILSEDLGISKPKQTYINEEVT